MQYRLFILLIFVICLLVLVGPVKASAGDRDPRYRECLSKCVVRKCERDKTDGSHSLFRKDFVILPDNDEVLYQAGFGEWLFGWACDENCQYECAQKNAILRRTNHEAIVQYHGKWPFVRIFGIQELFSSLFSFFNAIPHILFLSAMFSEPSLSDHQRFPADYSIRTAYFRPYWISWAIVGINTWFWSAVFHARDTVFTERMDYFSAYFLIIWGLWIAIIRTLSIKVIVTQFLILGGLLLWYGSHIFYLTFIHFDYGYNMLVNVLSAIISSLFWLVWIYQHRDRQYTRLLLWAILGVYPMSLLELLDFPPIFSLLDAHAIWHLSTVPCCFLLYTAIKADLLFETAKQS